MAEVPASDSTLNGFFQAFVMIVVSEIGDKTFLIAAIMATRHARATVFGGAFASLVVMSILSAALGRVILGLIPKVWTLWAAALLFAVFGVKMLQEAHSMSGGNSHIQEEMREVEEELEEDSASHDTHNARGTAIPLESVEEGRPARTSGQGSSLMDRSASPRPGRQGPSINFPLSNSAEGGVGPLEKGKHWTVAIKDRIRETLQMVTNPVFAQAFVLTFLGEWGDRSQITTIAMAGAHSVAVIAFGTIVGHGVCTCGAVLGGRYLSTKISVKHITLIGAVAFIIFAFLYSIEGYYYVPENDDF
ncbi:vacuolar protein [Cryptococcus wingfieldii CBS 7118]|uniref:GDT1 family protein n=1 Tax=Cryptococcus wingfieldii CBS 7118 TaxID=1295528 RepID=A0A1E3IW54_9TREE|nr:vacuolar protein [Cryptococcus wingfieldii CBS 7118]ODN92827.1 vacuolar protein [Cryptococcus wingfieldii CBS 7118]